MMCPIRISGDLLHILNKISDERLAEMYVEINTWKRPKELEDYKLEHFTTWEGHIGDDTPPLSIRILDWIHWQIGERKTHAAWIKYLDEQSKKIGYENWEAMKNDKFSISR